MWKDLFALGYVARMIMSREVIGNAFDNGNAYLLNILG